MTSDVTGASHADGHAPEVYAGSPPLLAPAAHDARGPGIERLRAGFPGAAVTGVCMVVGPCLAVVGSALGASSYHAHGADFVSGMVAHPSSFEGAIQLALSAMVLLLIAVVGLATMICATRPGWGRVAGVLVVVGLSGPISFESIYWAASHLTDSTGHRAAAAQLLDQSQVIPSTVLNVSGPALVVGFVVLAVAAAKAGVLGRLPSITLGVTAVVPFGFISGHLIISVVGFCGAALALVPLGVQMLRHR